MDAWRIIGWRYIAGIEGIFLMFPKQIPVPAERLLSVLDISPIWRKSRPVLMSGMNSMPDRTNISPDV